MAEIPTMVDLERDLPAHTSPHAEIWYVTGFLDRSDRRHGVQTMITTSPGGWVFTSSSLTDVVTGSERHGLLRRRLDDAVVRADRLEIDTGDVRLDGTPGELHLRNSFDGVSLDLRLVPRQPPLYSCVSGTFAYFGGPTWQFALPGMAVSGTVEVDGTSAAASGEVWLDRQWSTSRSAFGTANGFTWFGLWLDDGTALSVWDTTAADGSGAAWMTLANTAGAHTVATIALHATGGGPGTQPAQWLIGASGLDLRLTVSHHLLHEEHRFYCGLCSVEGSVAGRSVSGNGVVDTVPA